MKTLRNVDEVSITRASGGAQAQNKPKGMAPFHVTGVCPGYEQATAQSGASGACPPALETGQGGGLPALPVHADPQAYGGAACAPPAARQDRSGQPDHWTGPGQRC